jgi:hypothetical protein
MAPFRPQRAAAACAGEYGLPVHAAAVHDGRAALILRHNGAARAAGVTGG